MSKYQIQITYKTGDSNSSEKKVRLLDHEWANLDTAKENLQAIKEHYTYYSILDKLDRIKDCEFLGEKYKSNWWFVEDNGMGMYLKTDNGNTMRQSNFWCGYFEHLLEVNIIGGNLSFKTNYYGY